MKTCAPINANLSYRFFNYSFPCFQVTEFNTTNNYKCGTYFLQSTCSHKQRRVCSVSFGNSDSHSTSVNCWVDCLKKTPVQIHQNVKICWKHHFILQSTFSLLFCVILTIIIIVIIIIIIILLLFCFFSLFLVVFIGGTFALLVLSLVFMFIFGGEAD